MIDRPTPDYPAADDLKPSEIFTEREARLFALPAKIRRTFRECCPNYSSAESPEDDAFALGVLIGALEVVSAEAVEIYEDAKQDATTKAPCPEAPKPVTITSDDSLLFEMDKTINDLKHKIQTLEIHLCGAKTEANIYKDALASAHAQLRRTNPAPVAKGEF